MTSHFITLRDNQIVQFALESFKFHSINSMNRETGIGHSRIIITDNTFLNICLQVTTTLKLNKFE